MPRPMSDTKLAEHCKTYKLARQQADKEKGIILDELNRRGVAVGDEVEGVRKHGFTLRKKAQRLRYYDVGALKKILSAKLRGTVVYEAVRVPVLDELVKSGQISGDAVKDCLDHVDVSEPYIDVRWAKRD